MLIALPDRSLSPGNPGPRPSSPGPTHLPRKWFLRMSEYTCLLVEDSPVMRQLITFALSRVKGLRVVEAEDGVEGLKKLAAARFDIILTDINMPILDGLKLIQRVRTDPRHEDTPVVIITTEGAAEDRSRATDLGANAYITKPIQSADVVKTVKGLLGIA